MIPFRRKLPCMLLTVAAALASLNSPQAQEPLRGATSYMPVDIKEPFPSIMARMKAEAARG